MTNRRTVLKGAVALAAAPLSAAEKSQVAARVSPKTYLLVHGSGHGGWCWEYVANILRGMGHAVFAPSLTGLGDRYHLRSPQVSLNTHIEDLTDLIDVEDLHSVIIVAHSYGGYPVTGACDRRRDRIGHVVYMDAAAPKNGDYNAQMLGPEWIAKRQTTLLDGYLMEAGGPTTLQGLGIPPENKALSDWVLKRLRPHPFRTWIEPIQLLNGGSEGLPRSYVFGNAAAENSPLRRHAQLRRADPSYQYAELPCGHDMMLLRPAETATLLAAIQPPG
jgi:pimeloyl-ACP methyl ester carboxylesterase